LTFETTTNQEQNWSPRLISPQSFSLPTINNSHEVRYPAKLRAEERPSESEEALFLGRQGPLFAEGVAAGVAKYAEWSRLEGVTPHILRHTFAYSYLENNNNDLMALADILGHTDLNTTRIYQTATGQSAGRG
jgi:site-specific recombinase XerD